MIGSYIYLFFFVWGWGGGGSLIWREWSVRSHQRKRKNEKEEERKACKIESLINFVLRVILNEAIKKVPNYLIF